MRESSKSSVGSPFCIACLKASRSTFVGQILNSLHELDLERDTLVLFTSDNGPWYLDRHPTLKKQRDEGGSHGGAAGPLRGHKTSPWEGGVRVPCLMRWPGHIPAGRVRDDLAATIDFLPTFARLAGTTAPDDRVLDGRDIGRLITGREEASEPSTAFYYYQQTRLSAVRSGKWKLHLPRPIHPQWAVFSMPARRTTA